MQCCARKALKKSPAPPEGGSEMAKEGVARERRQKKRRWRRST